MEITAKQRKKGVRPSKTRRKDKSLSRNRTDKTRKIKKTSGRSKAEGRPAVTSLFECTKESS